MLVFRPHRRTGTGGNCNNAGEARNGASRGYIPWLIYRQWRTVGVATSSFHSPSLFRINCRNSDGHNGSNYYNVEEILYSVETILCNHHVRYFSSKFRRTRTLTAFRPLTRTDDYLRGGKSPPEILAFLLANQTARILTSPFPLFCRKSR
jgi:hypothetical protein